MITAILTMAVVWCLFYGRMPTGPLILLCVALGFALALLSRHSHTHFFTIDVLAQTSRLNRWNPTLKFWVVLTLMVVCIAAESPVTGVFLTAAMLIITVFGGGLPLRDYVHVMALPISFLLLGGIALVFEITKMRTGVFGAQVFGLWICMTAETQIRATLVIARALGAVSCLYLLSLTTPMSEIISVLRRAHCPDVLIELMYLIYRYIFVLLSMYHTMHDAAKSRLGHMNFRTSLRTAGNLYSNLLARSYRHASQNFDAMESRCFDTEIRFLEHRKQVTAAQVVFAVAAITAASSLTLWSLWGNG